MNPLKNIKYAEQRLTALYILTVFSVFMLFLPEDKLMGAPVRLFLFGALTAAASAALLLLLCKRKIRRRKRLYGMDLCMLALLLCAAGQLAVCFLQGRSDIEPALLTGISAAVYFMLTVPQDCMTEVFHDSMLNVLQAACAVVYIELLLHIFVFPGLQGPVGILLLDRTALGSFLVLSVTVTVLQYCGSRRAAQDRALFVMAGAGFFLLFLYKDIAGIILAGLLFILIPLIFLPTAELVRRDLIMAFLFFFLLSSTVLAVNVTQWIKTGVRYDMRVSIVIDLLTAAAGMAAYLYWDRIPEAAAGDLVVLKRARRIFLFLLYLYGFLLAGAWCAGPMEKAGGGSGAAVFRLFAQAVKDALRQSDGTFRQALRECGPAGFALAAVIYAAVGARLQKRVEKGAQQARLTAAAVMFMAQSLFYKQQIVTTPVYTILVTAALFSGARKERHYEETEKSRMGMEADPAAGGGSA